MCDCIELLNKAYADKGINTQVSQAVAWDGVIENAMVVVEKRNPRMHGKAVKIFASYCPFCGKRYDVGHIPDNMIPMTKSKNYTEGSD
jgi:hypothetical protein